MMSLTRKTDYALVALAFLATQSAEDDKAVSARRIADQFNLPLPLLMNILKELGHAGLVQSVRGQQGGYMLSRDPKRIFLLDVVLAMEGQLRLAPCALAEDHGDACHLMGECLVHGAVRRLHQRIEGFLREVSLADLLDSQVDVTVRQVGALVDSGVS
ncbi:MAG: Rrf2 family transcriptional regulator [Phycisphaeraceae bacterium]|nr:Rrf2 family transcriptional regulator [Phycisphaeraceae bacterium]